MECKEVLDRIMDRLDTIEEKQSDMVEKVNELTTAWPYMARRITRIETVLYGNGKSGIIGKVSTIMWFIGIMTALIVSLAQAILMKVF